MAINTLLNKALLSPFRNQNPQSQKNFSQQRIVGKILSFAMSL